MAYDRNCIVWKLGYIPQLFTRYYCNLSCIAKDVVGLRPGEVVRTKKHIGAKDVVGLRVEDSKNDSLTKMKTY